MPSARLTSWTYRWWGISAASTESRTKVNSIARQMIWTAAIFYLVVKLRTRRKGRQAVSQSEGCGRWSHGLWRRGSDSVCTTDLYTRPWCTQPAVRVSEASGQGLVARALSAHWFIVHDLAYFRLTPSLPRCHLKTANKSAKCETLNCFCLYFSHCHVKGQFPSKYMALKVSVIGVENILFAGTSVYLKTGNFKD